MGVLQKAKSWFIRPASDQRGETRSVAINDGAGLAELFGQPLDTAVPVTEQTAMRLSAVYACVRVLSEGVAMLPHQVYKRNGERRDAQPDHPVSKLLHTRPNPLMTPFVFKRTVMALQLLWGNAYARIIRDGAMRPVELRLFEPGDVSVFKFQDRLYYQTPGGVLPAEDILHFSGLGFDGICGRSPIRMQAESIGVTLAAQQYGSKFFKNGAHLTGILSTKDKLLPDSRKAAKEQFNAGYSGMNNAGKTAILDGGLEYTRIGVPPEEAQFLDTRKYGREDICGIYRVPPHMIANLDRATFSNIEHQDTAFVKHSLMSWLVAYEQECDEKLFYEREKGRLYTKYNVNALLRGDTTARTAHYKEMIQNGVYSINDVREMEDMNPVDGGDERYMQMQYVPISRVGELVDSTIEKNKAPKPAPQTTSNGTGTKSNTGE